MNSIEQQLMANYVLTGGGGNGVEWKHTATVQPEESPTAKVKTPCPPKPTKIESPTATTEASATATQAATSTTEASATATQAATSTETQVVTGTVENTSTATATATNTATATGTEPGVLTPPVDKTITATFTPHEGQPSNTPQMGRELAVSGANNVEVDGIGAMVLGATAVASATIPQVRRVIVKAYHQIENFVKNSFHKSK